MWVKVDDGFPEHPKVLKAAEILDDVNGVKNSAGRVAAVWLEAMCYANRHLTDGFISETVAKRFHFDGNPMEVLRVMARKTVRLMETTPGGWKIHDYHEYQPKKEKVEEKRKNERDRKRRVRGLSARTNDGQDSVSAQRPRGQIRASVDPGPAQPVPTPRAIDQVPRAVARRAHLDFVSTSDIGSHLRAAVHELLDREPDATDGDAADAVKVAAGKCRAIDYNGRSATTIVDAVRGERARRHG